MIGESVTFPGLPTAAIIVKDVVHYNVMAISVILNSTFLLAPRVPVYLYDMSTMCALTESGHGLRAADTRIATSNCFDIHQVIYGPDDCDLVLLQLERPMTGNYKKAYIPKKDYTPNDFFEMEYHNVKLAKMPYSPYHYGIHDYIKMKAENAKVNGLMYTADLLLDEGSSTAICPYYNGVPLLKKISDILHVIGLQYYVAPGCPTVTYKGKVYRLSMEDCARFCTILVSGERVKVDYVSTSTETVFELFKKVGMEPK